VLSVYAVYKLSVHVNDIDKNKPLHITHFPQILGSESTKVAQTITVLVSLSLCLCLCRFTDLYVFLPDTSATFVFCFILEITPV